MLWIFVNAGNVGENWGVGDGGGDDDDHLFKKKL